MSELSNAFSLLELDVEDNREQTASPAENGKDKIECESLGEKSNNGHHHCLEVLTGEYRLPLVWIDLEMTGLDIEKDRILEIACIITDGNLTKSVEGPDLVIHQTKECMDGMGEWCQSHHGASGLTERVLQSTITEKEAENQVADFVKKHVQTFTPMLAGNSVYVDFLFLKVRLFTFRLPKPCVSRSFVHQVRPYSDHYLLTWINPGFEIFCATRYLKVLKLGWQLNITSWKLYSLRKSTRWRPSLKTLALAGCEEASGLAWWVGTKYMPKLASLFIHVLVDVSSIKALCIRWFPKDSKKAPKKENKHRAMDDIKESIAELKYYKETIFKPSKSRK